MITRAPRRTALHAISCASLAALVLAGCSSSDEPDATEGPSSSASAGGGDSSEDAAPSDESQDSAGAGTGAFDKDAATEVLLTAEEVGAGFTAVPEEDLSAALAQTTGDLGQALASMQVEPPQCQAVLQDMMGQMGDLASQIDQTAMGLFTKDTDIVSESIAPAAVLAPGDLDAQVDACQQMTLTIQGITASATMTPVELDLGEDSMALMMSIKINAGGQEVNQTSAQSIVVQGDNALSLTLTGAIADEATLTDLTTKAFEKAEPVLG